MRNQVWKGVKALLTGDPVEIEEWISAGGLSALDCLFARRSTPKLPKFDEVVALRPNEVPEQEAKRKP